MSDFTKHLRLIKPSGNEYYNVEQFNHNAELIDKETEDLSNKVAKIQEGATREKAGIVQLGTEEGKALEGMMLARLAGAYGYGGDIQDEGVKNPNYIYYDRNTRKMYKCLKQNQDISANVANFVPLDNNSLLERLENLFKYESASNWQTIVNCDGMNAKIYIIDKIMIQNIWYSFSKKIGKTRLQFPKSFSSPPFVTLTDNDTGAAVSNNLLSVDWASSTYVDVNNLQSGFTMLVIGSI